MGNLRKEILEYVNNAEEESLLALEYFISNYCKTSNRYNESFKDYENEILKAEKAFDEGRTFTHAEVKEKMASWKK